MWYCIKLTGLFQFKLCRIVLGEISTEIDKKTIVNPYKKLYLISWSLSLIHGLHERK